MNISSYNLQSNYTTESFNNYNNLSTAEIKSLINEVKKEYNTCIFTISSLNMLINQKETIIQDLINEIEESNIHNQVTSQSLIQSPLNQSRSDIKNTQNHSQTEIDKIKINQIDNKFKSQSNQFPEMNINHNTNSQDSNLNNNSTALKNQFQRKEKCNNKVKQLKQEIIQLRRSHNKEMEKIEKEEKEKTEKEIEKIEKEYMNHLTEMNDTNNKIISDIQSEIRYLQERLSQEMISIEEHEHILISIEKSVQKEMSYLKEAFQKFEYSLYKESITKEEISNIKVEIEKVIGRNEYVEYMKSILENKDLFCNEVSLTSKNIELSNKSILDKRDLHVNSSNNRYNNSIYSSGSDMLGVIDDDSDESLEVEDEIKINKVNCFKIDSFRRKNRLVN